MNNNRLGDISKEWIKYQSITEYDVDWLIFQVQELRAENKRIKQLSYRNAYEQGKFDTNMKVWYEIPRVEKQNERYREAIVRAKTLLANIGDDTSSKMSAISILTKPLEGEE